LPFLSTKLAALAVETLNPPKSYICQWHKYRGFPRRYCCAPMPTRSGWRRPRKNCQMDRTLPISGILSMNDVIASWVAQPRLIAQFIGVFAGFALLRRQ
jgi:hypothetical protein